MNDTRGAGRVGSDEAAPSALARALAEQRDCWRRGERVPVEACLERTPDLRASAEDVLDLIYNEMLLREEAGEAPQLDEYLRRFPHLADDLQIQFEVERALDVSGADRPTFSEAGRPAAPAAPGAAPPGYELLGELGRGGMGVVYKARQVSLNRTVALKMVLAGAHAGAEDLARFRTEAEAAARLQHPNIVQIHEVGEHQGAPFFSLEFVDGGSLAERLHGVPQPPREAAALVETLARAMHHAHRQGIVHRDLKPANVLLSVVGCQLSVVSKESRLPSSLTTDNRQLTTVPKIADFGLAKLLARDGAGQTHSGDLLGTPSYMAPEQAAGRLREVGPCTDVYALGAILYELLTGRPPFQGATALDTLAQVVAAEPVPPSRLQPKVRRDLETVCLKCLEKSPARRYATAEDLAEDLRRFLANEPVRARPVGPAERLGKWVRRRPALAALLGVIVVASLLLLAGSWLAAVREGRQRAEAEENFRDALEAVEQLLAEVGEVDLADVPHLEPVRERLLRRALGFYQRFLARRGADPALRQETARVLGRVGDIQELLGKPGEAEPAYDQAIALLEPLAAGSPGAAGPRRELARCHHNRGVLLKKAGRAAEAEQAFRRALALRAELAGRQPAEPDDRQDLAASHYQLGALLAPLAGRRPDAEEAYGQALTVQERLGAEFPDRPRYRRDLARTLNNLGVLQKATGRPEAEQSFGRARDLQRELTAQDPTAAGPRRDLARSCSNLATVLAAAGKRGPAVEAFGEAEGLLQGLAADFPAVPEYRHDLAGVQTNRGQLLQALGKTAEAETAFRAAVARSAALAEAGPGVPAYRQRLAAGQCNLAVLLEETGRPAEAEAAYRQALLVQERLAAEAPGVPDHQAGLGATLNNLARLLLWRGDLGEPGQGAELVLSGAAPPWGGLGALARGRLALAEARGCLDRAVAHDRAARDANPLSPQYRDYLRNDHALLAVVLLRLGDHAGAAAAAEELPRLVPDAPGEYVRAAGFLARCVSPANGDERLPEGQRREVAQAYARRAVELLREAVSRGYKDVNALKRLPEYEPLRGREDFQKLLRELESRTGTAVG
jgi:serine/threonine protein kinase/tetratricopeptide (TPR) repeat protein